MTQKEAIQTIVDKININDYTTAHGYAIQLLDDLRLNLPSDLEPLTKEDLLALMSDAEGGNR